MKLEEQFSLLKMLSGGPPMRGITMGGPCCVRGLGSCQGWLRSLPDPNLSMSFLPSACSAM